MHTYGLTRETLAKVSMKNHYNGSLNPKAHLQRKVTVEEVLTGRLSPIRLGCMTAARRRMAPLRRLCVVPIWPRNIVTIIFW
jgi:acetyl-CoA acetyltransferase